MPAITLTVAICTHNRPEDTIECLVSLYAQDLSGVQVVVVDSASRPDAHHSIVQTTAYKTNVQLIRLETPGTALARNAALAASADPWIAYLDDDVVVAADWVAQAKRLIAAAPRHCPIIAGRVDPLYPPRAVPRIGPRWRQLLSLVQDEGEGEDISANVVCANVIFRCDRVKAIGSFPEALGRVGEVRQVTGEEKLIVEQLCEEGWHVFYSDRLRVDHKVPAGRLMRQWAAKRAFWDGVTDQKIRRLMHRPIGILGVAKTAAAIPVLAVLAPSNSPTQEFFIRFWYDVGSIAELFFK
jgi:glycosyltransferase involved in cell wall biosynthesis